MKHYIDYSEQYKSPKWQKRRLEILSKDNFTCQVCGDKESQLHIHHLHYEKGKDRHEYDDKTLITLCDNCHKNEHEWQNMTVKEFFYELMDKNISMFEIMAICENISVSMYLGNKNKITDICGEGIGVHSETELKDLEDRRNG